MAVCVVSGYYKIPSKQPHSFYAQHLQRWFRSVKAPVVFFTTTDIKEEIQSWGYSLDHILFVDLVFEDLQAWKKFGRDFWERQKARDPEPYHTPELAAIWYEKKEFVLRAMDLCPDKQIFIWCDAGCIRTDSSEKYAIEFGSRNKPLNDNKIHIQKIKNIPTKEFYTYPDCSIAGAVIAGNRTAWINHSHVYDIIQQVYDDVGIPGCMDQYIIKSCTDKYPEFYILHTPPPDLGMDRWFFFLQTI